MVSDPPADQRPTWECIDAAFQSALKQDPGQRRDWVSTNFHSQPKLRDAVLGLLADEKASDVLFKQVLNARDEIAGSLLDDQQGDNQAGSLSGSMIGPYRLDALIAIGGMGAVYRAMRMDGQFEQTVAIKILPGWATDPQTIERLIAERQILANLQHPNITRLLDGGQTADGFPYLVLEFIHGQNIAEYIEHKVPTLTQRLELFERIADAIHYAHQNLVIHRDIKPANILVDQAGNPQVLDFGIAKLLDIGVHNGPLTTDGFTPMTPEYASPEQRSGKQVTTASDIYQLGLLLFNLLAGFSTNRDADTTTRPSTVVLQEKESGSLPQGVEPARFARQLKGDLDTIVLKALRENPQDRYLSAADMADDVRHHLHGEAIEARPESWWATTKRVSRNYPVAVSLVATLVSVVIIWATSLFFYSQELERQRDEASHQALRANQVKDVLIEIFHRTDPMEAATIGGKTTSVWDSLDVAAEQAREQLLNEPDIQAELFATLAELYRDAGMLDKARVLQGDAVGLLEGLGPGYEVQLASYRADYASILNTTDGWLLLQDSLNAIPGFVKQNPAAAIGILLDAAHLKESIGESGQALGYFRQARDIFQSEGMFDPSLQVELFAGEAKALIGEGRLQQADELLQQALQQGEVHFGPQHRRLAIVLNGLDKLNRKRGNYDQAIVYGERLVRVLEAGSASSNDSLLVAKNNLALAYGGAGQFGQEQEIHREIIAIKRSLSAPLGYETLGISLKNLASSLHRSGDYEEALEVLAESKRLMQENLPENNVYQAFPHFTAALIYIDSGQPKAAEKESKSALAILEPALGEQHFQVQLTRCVLAEAWRVQGRSAEARIMAVPALQGMLTASATIPTRYINRCRNTVAELSS